MIVDGQEVTAGAGDVVVIGPETQHRMESCAGLSIKVAPGSSFPGPI
jgi:hypothetical protein